MAHRPDRGGGDSGRSLAGDHRRPDRVQPVGDLLGPVPVPGDVAGGRGRSGAAHDPPVLRLDSCPRAGPRGISKLRSIPVVGITLYMFGGATQARIESRGPADEFLVTAVAPGPSLALGRL